MSGSGFDGQVPVLVHQRMLIQPGGGKAAVGFDNGKIIITYPTTGPPNTRTIFRPKEVQRIDPVTLKVNSGFLDFGWLTFKFESEEDSVKVELKIREILPG
ncbi:hypothetical protein E6H11_06280 [Candidatus Bathyarchaeota archaeon]|nr:MAG: hypothetical protein E6H11_06280 [Candidatus Bathyarchaeota archaeon]